jgi:hypothetical protein
MSALGLGPGDDDEDFEQSCRPNKRTADPKPTGDAQPGEC